MDRKGLGTGWERTVFWVQLSPVQVLLSECWALISSSSISRYSSFMLFTYIQQRVEGYHAWESHRQVRLSLEIQRSGLDRKGITVRQKERRGGGGGYGSG